MYRRVYLRPEENAALERLADATGASFSAIFRHLLRVAGGLTYSHGFADALDRAGAELARDAETTGRIDDPRR